MKLVLINDVEKQGNLINYEKESWLNMDYKSIEEIDKNPNSLDSLAPYVGKMRPELVNWLIKKFAYSQGTIYDPFSGSGTVLLEGWRNGYNVIGSDLNEYAIVLSKGKMNPYVNEQVALEKLTLYKTKVKRRLNRSEEIQVPEWVSQFYHPDTLKEICAWVRVLKYNREWFFLSCLLGILHHQRPGFLSYPSSHGAPYLRTNKYPKEEYPDMYEYREVFPRLEAKISRVYKKMPKLDYSIGREVYKKDAAKIKMIDESIETIITSPPYMKSLTYARDNRLRLWFLGIEDWQRLDKRISPDRNFFYEEMIGCFQNWYKMQPPEGRCILVVGNLETKYRGKKYNIPDALVEIAMPYYYLLDAYVDPIPEKRKVVKGNTKVKQEVVLVFRRR